MNGFLYHQIVYNYPYMYLYGYTETRSIKVYAECKGIVVLVLLLNQLDKDWKKNFLQITVSKCVVYILLYLPVKMDELNFCCSLLIKLFCLFQKLFCLQRLLQKGLPITWLLFQSSLLQCNCQRYSELQEPIIILLTCKKLLSTHLVNTYSSKTLAWNTSDTELFILGI